MRKVSKIAGVLVVLTLYFFAIVFRNDDNGNTYNSILLELTHPDTTSYGSESSSSLLCNIYEPGISITAFGNTLPLVLKKPSKGFSACVETIEKLLGNTFLQYNFYSKNVLIRFGQPDIIFPSHYFW